MKILLFSSFIVVIVNIAFFTIGYKNVYNNFLKEVINMKIERFSFSGTAGNALEAYIWSPDGEPKVILQVTHGMTEHMGRYEKLRKNWRRREL